MAAALDHPDTAALFRALGDPRRLAILADLAARGEPARVMDIGTCCGIDVSGVSRHLKTLRDAGLVSAKKQGRETLYALRARELADALEATAERIRSCC